MNTQENSVINIIEGFAAASNPAESLNNYLLMLPKLPRGYFIRQFEIFHKSELSQIIINKSKELTSFNLINTSPSFFEFKYMNKGKTQTEEGFCAILPSNKPNISRVTTISTPFFWGAVIRKLVSKFYPDAMPVFFRQDEIEYALKELEKSLGFKNRIRIADATVKEARDQSSNNKQKKYDTQRWWTDLSISDVFSQAKERGQWFTGLKFKIQRRIGDSEIFSNQSSGRLYKFGEIYYDSFYSEITSTLLNHLEDKAYSRLVTLEGRGLRERNYKPVSPLEIAFDYEIFSDIEEIRRFGRVVASYPKSTKVIYHSNPYYHANLADFVDGSSFEVWVLSSNKIVLIPQAKSSAQAFERFIGHVSSNFYEGVVDEYRG